MLVHIRKQDNNLKRLVNERDLQQILKYNSKKILQNNSQPYTTNNFEDEDAPYQIKKSKQLTKLIDPINFRAYNHLSSNYQVCNKKSLFFNMRAYYSCLSENVFDYLPLTFHIKEGLEDQQYKQFLAQFDSLQSVKKCKNIWIVKPGENTNRGHGITVAKSIETIKQLVSQSGSGQDRTFILQKYIESPLLYNKRKFDLRCYLLLTKSISGIKGESFFCQPLIWAVFLDRAQRQIATLFDYLILWLPRQVRSMQPAQFVCCAIKPVPAGHRPFFAGEVILTDKTVAQARAKGGTVACFLK